MFFEKTTLVKNLAKKIQTNANRFNIYLKKQKRQNIIQTQKFSNF